ncbi:MAG: HNH endonuclease [Eggerthellaceae bacterium]|nr:HNH endonuclease [Eggerthellaceae bacterium]MBR3161029.1 HNH endonuclease [Atopobiaceae bacterium]MBR3161033.1 HNH endonuclease [Atopobiaceae bacterium]
MAQSFAKGFYNSHAWLASRKRYLDAVVDTSGNILVSKERDGDIVYVRKDDPNETPVPSECVIPPRMCERCFKRGELTPAKVVHHIEHITPENIDDPHVTLRYANMQRLCQDCHAFVHSGQTEPRVTFDENGNVVPKNESLQSMIERLTETVDESRNIYRSKR